MLSGTRILLLAALAVASSGCGTHPASEPAAALHPAVKVVRLAPRAFNGGIEAQGQWKAALETVVPTPCDAVVDSITVRPGDRVRRGQLLVWCITAESDAALRGAQIMASQASDPGGRADAARALAQARASIVRVPVLSPASGTVLRRPAEMGARLPAGAELLALVADDALVFEIRVGVEQAASVRLGMVAIVTDGQGPAHDATVWTFPPVAAGDQSALVWLRPTALVSRAAIGRFGTASIRTTASTTQLAVPDSAVVEDDLTGTHWVMAVDSAGVVHRVEVQLGAHEGNARAIEGPGLGPGTAVIVDGPRDLTDGMSVVVHP